MTETEDTATNRNKGKPAPGTSKGSGATPAKSRPAAPEETVASITITHPERLLFDGGISKLDLARYYAVVADRMLPYAARHLLSLVRAPQGLKGPRFYQKHAGDGFPEEIKEMAITESSAKRKLHVRARCCRPGRRGADGIARIPHLGFAGRCA